MRVINMQDVKNRKRNMSPSFYKESHIGLTPNIVSTNFARLVDIGYSKMIAENVIEQMPKYDNSDFAFRQILEVFEMICENENASYITKMGNIIAEGSVPKTRTGAETKHYLKMKVARFKTKLHTKFNTNIKNTKSAATDAIEAIQKNLSTNTAHIKDNINKSIKKEDTSADEAALAAYEKIYEAYNNAIDCDRILENQAKINKHYNLAETVKTYYNDPQQAIVEMCSMIDSFNMSSAIKYNVSLENTLYTFAECNVSIDPSIVVETVTDYYLIHTSPLNDKAKSSMSKVLESSSLFGDDIKDSTNSLFKDIAKLDIKFDDTFVLLQEKPDMSKCISENEILKQMLSESGNKENPVKVLFDKFKLEAEKTPEKLKSLVRKMYVQSAEDIIAETPNILSWIRRFLVIGGGVSVSPIVGVVALIADEMIKIEISRKQLSKYIDKYKKELENTDNVISICKDSNDKSRLQEYKRGLERAIEKLEDKEEKLYNDDENIARKSENITHKAHKSNDPDDDDDDDYFFDDFDDDDLDESFVNSVASLSMLAELTSESDYDITDMLIGNIEGVDADGIANIQKYMQLYPETVNTEAVVSVYEHYLQKSASVYNESNTNKRFAMQETLRFINSYNTSAVATDPIRKCYAEAFRLSGMIEGYNAISEYIGSLSSLNEMDFSNTMKLVSERLKTAIKSLSDNEKQLSRNIDVACGQVSKSAEKALMNENREAVIRGSLIPSASKIIKNAIVTGAAWAVNPAVAVIGVMGSIAVSKKLQAKERQLILDDIEIELSMCERYLKIAEDNNDMKAQRSLLQTKRSLERQRQRIKYKMAVYYNQKTDIKKSDDYMDEAALLEAVLDKDWVKNREANIAKIKKAAETGDEGFLDKVGRLILANTTMITMISVVGTAGNPLLLPATLFGGVLGTVIGGLFSEAVMDKKKIIMMTEYQTIIRNDIATIKSQKVHFAKGDTEKIANADKIIKALQKADDMLEVKIKKARNSN